MNDHKIPHQNRHQPSIEKVQINLGFGGSSCRALGIFGDAENVSDQNHDTRRIHDTQVSDPMDGVMDRYCGWASLDASVEDHSDDNEVGKDKELNNQTNDDDLTTKTLH